MTTKGFPLQIYETAFAKLNLYLHILSKRDDGYHNLESLICFLDFGDRVCLEEKHTGSINRLHLSGSRACSLREQKKEENLAWKAAEAFQVIFGRRAFEINLEKQIPVGAGLGGGSADAAAVLRALARYYSVPLSNPELQALSEKLGADVPACLYSRPVLVSGIGECLSPVPLAINMPLLLVNPNQSVLTEKVFMAYARQGTSVEQQALKQHSFSFSGEKAEDLSEQWINWLKGCQNDLEASAVGFCPDIVRILKVLGMQKGQEFARMTGSGATCFGFFTTEALVEQAKKEIRKVYPDWWVMSCRLRSEPFETLPYKKRTLSG